MLRWIGGTVKETKQLEKINGPVIVRLSGQLLDTG